MPIYQNMPESDYRADPAVANSDLKALARSPAHFKARQSEPRVDTPAMTAGRALHCAILEPEMFLARYCVEPADAPRKPSSVQRNAKNPSDETRAAIQWWDNWNTSYGHMESLSAEKYDEYMRIGEVIRSHPAVRPYLFSEGDAETSVFAEDPKTGTKVKCRPDRRAMIDGLRVCLDVKSTEDARRPAFERTAYNFGYFQGAAFYSDVQAWAGEPIDLYLLVAFEREAPYSVKVYEVSADDMERGRRQYRRALDTYAECVRNGEWPGYDDAIEVLEMPAWAPERRDNDFNNDTEDN